MKEKARREASGSKPGPVEASEDRRENEEIWQAVRGGEKSRWIFDVYPGTRTKIRSDQTQTNRLSGIIKCQYQVCSLYYGDDSRYVYIGHAYYQVYIC